MDELQGLDQTTFFINAGKPGSEVAAEIAAASLVFRKFDPVYSNLLLKRSMQKNAKVVSIDSYEDVPENDASALKKAVANQPISVAIEAEGRAFQLSDSEKPAKKSRIFTPSDDMEKEVVAASELSGKKFWRMPMEESYWKNMKSGVADVANSRGRKGGSILAALFLKQICTKLTLDIFSTKLRGLVLK